MLQLTDLYASNIFVDELCRLTGCSGDEIGGEFEVVVRVFMRVFEGRRGL